MKIGRVYACIAGDHRYGTALEVHATNTSTRGTVIQVLHLSTVARGGMDGGGGLESMPTRIVLELEGTKPAKLAADLLKGLRRLFKTVDDGTIAEYGTPTKKFTWFDGDGQRCGMGMSAALAQRALKALS